MKRFWKHILVPTGLLSLGWYMAGVWGVSALKRQGPPVKSFLRLGASTIHYRVEGAGAPVVCIHGSPGSLSDFDTVRPLLARTYRVYCYDRPGYGYSSSLSGSNPAETQATQLHRFLVGENIRRPILVAHSWGALVALAFALRFPHEVSGIVVINPWVYPESASVPFPSSFWTSTGPGCFLLQPVLLMRRSSVIQSILADGFHPEIPPASYQRTCELLWWQTPEQLGTTREEFEDQTAVLLQRRYSKIQLPVTILYGARDLLVDSKLQSLPLQRAIPHASIRRIEGGGHYVHFNHPDVILDAVEAVRAK